MPFCIDGHRPHTNQYPIFRSNPDPPLTPSVTPGQAPGAAASPGADAGWSAGTITTIVLILVVLALLGLNIFTYLAKGTDLLSTLLGDTAARVPGAIGDTLGWSAQGTKFGLDVVGGAVQDAGVAVQDVGDIVGEEKLNIHSRLGESRNRAFKDAVDRRQMDGIDSYPSYEPDKEDNGVQRPHKPGWCYIGTDRGYRSCIKVGDSDKCMSGEIFPTKDICISPSLRK